MDFELAYRRLTSATPSDSAKAAEAVAGEFGNSLLTAEIVSDGHIDFISRVLTDPVVARQPGLNQLILMLYLDRAKLSESQLDRFLGRLTDSFSHLADENLAFAIGDFIARVASPEHALELLLKMTAKATSLQTLAGVFVGLDILRKRPAGISTDAVDAAVRATEQRSVLLQNEADAVQDHCRVGEPKA